MSSLDPKVQAYIDAAVAQARADVAAEYEEKTSALQAEVDSLKGSQLAPSPVTEHAAGVGTEIASTWSQYEQELARIGEHEVQRA